MKYQSTRSAQTTVSASEAIVQGISRDGGLFVPQSFPHAELDAWSKLDYSTLAARVISGFLTDYDPDFLQQAAAQTYGAAFAGKAGQLCRVRDGLYSLELWHGPTCAFKDYALQLMPKLLAEAKKNLGRTEKTRILVATSGDTGKAALEGYRDLDGIEISVFYPNDGTSAVQRLQMATQAGNNVAVYAVEGNFDDAQTGVKRVFCDADAAQALEKRGIRLSSANSINWGRLVPQIVYYFYSYFRLVEQGEITMGQSVDYCVPTGNFGDILAGYYAAQMGLPVGHLVCASNKNNVLTDFIKTGTYDAHRTFYKTESPSMDILVSSNLERLLYHLSGSAEQVSGYMAELADKSIYTVDTVLREKLGVLFACGYADDAQGEQEIQRLYAEDHYLCDTHTAVAFCVAEQNRTRNPMVVLSTASPFKFPRAVLRALGDAVPENEFAAMRLLAEKTGQTIPPALDCLDTLPVRFDRVIRPAQILDAALR
jgi:threonine synthase